MQLEWKCRRRTREPRLPAKLSVRLTNRPVYDRDRYLVLVDIIDQITSFTIHWPVKKQAKVDKAWTKFWPNIVIGQNIEILLWFNTTG